MITKEQAVEALNFVENVVANNVRFNCTLLEIENFKRAFMVVKEYVSPTAPTAPAPEQKNPKPGR